MRDERGGEEQRMVDVSAPLAVGFPLVCWVCWVCWSLPSSSLSLPPHSLSAFSPSLSLSLTLFPSSLPPPQKTTAHLNHLSLPSSTLLPQQTLLPSVVISGWWLSSLSPLFCQKEKRKLKIKKKIEISNLIRTKNSKGENNAWIDRGDRPPPNYFVPLASHLTLTSFPLSLALALASNKPFTLHPSPLISLISFPPVSPGCQSFVLLSLPVSPTGLCLTGVSDVVCFLPPPPFHIARFPVGFSPSLISTFEVRRHSESYGLLPSPSPLYLPLPIAVRPSNLFHPINKGIRLSYRSIVAIPISPALFVSNPTLGPSQFRRQLSAPVTGWSVKENGRQGTGFAYLEVHAVSSGPLPLGYVVSVAQSFSPSLSMDLLARLGPRSCRCNGNAALGGFPIGGFSFHRLSGQRELRRDAN